MKRVFLGLLCIMVLLVGCQMTADQEGDQKDISPVQTNQETKANTDPSERGRLTITSIEDLPYVIAQMTLEEKAGQMIQAERGGIQLSEISAYNIGSILSGGGSAPQQNTSQGWVDLYNRMQRVSRNSSSGIPLLYGIDAVHGHNNVAGAVIFPHNIGLGAANDPYLLKTIGQAVADEMNATGINWNFAPALSVVQDLRWGRTYEGFSEASERVASLGSAYIEGLQSKGILATAKHFIGDGYTTYGTGEGSALLDRGDVTVPLEKLLDVYLPVYEKAIASGTASIMVSFNSVNGVKMHEHTYLLQEVLRGQLGFRGLIVSDWEAIHALEGTLKDQVASAINAGVDMLMQPYNWKEVYHAIIDNVKEGHLTEARLDESLLRILEMKFKAGLFKPDFEKTPGEIGAKHVRAVAREAVSKSMVLLKNQGQVLPLKKSARVYLIGPASDDLGVQSGGWTMSWQGDLQADLVGGTTIKEAFKDVLEANGGKLVDEINEADLVVVAIGEKPYAEMNGDSADLSLDGPLALSENLEALSLAKSSGKPILTLLVAGRPLLVEEELNEWDAFVMLWLPGTEGLGITDVLFGDVPFTGTLPVTWPKENAYASDSVHNEASTPSGHRFEYGFGLTYP